MPLSLKLMLDPSVAEALQDAALFWQLSQPAPRVQRLTLHFFDTPDGLLRSQRLRLCVWREAAQWRQALQADEALPLAPALWLGQRWEMPLAPPSGRPKAAADARPDVAALLRLAGHAAAALASPGLQARLQPQAQARVRRSMQWQQLPEGEWVAWTLDQPLAGATPAGAGFCELRLHPQAGHEAPLLSLARHWLAALPAELALCRPPVATVAADGNALPATGIKARPLRLRRAMSLEQGLQAAAANCLAQVQANAPGVLTSPDPECVHQMRVGLRRLQSAWRVLGARPPAALAGELRWLGRLLGEARNAEVLAGETLATLAPLPPALAQAAREQALALRAEAAAGLASVRYASLMLGLRAWNQAPGWHEAATPETRAGWQAPLRPALAQRLDRLLARLRRRGRRPRHAAPHRLHRARILAKRLRYAAEFCQHLLPQRRLAAFIETLARLQAHWGRQQDLAVAEALLRRLARQQPALTEACRAASLALAQRHAADAHPPELRAAWKRLRRQAPPWDHGGD